VDTNELVAGFRNGVPVLSVIAEAHLPNRARESVDPPLPGPN